MIEQYVEKRIKDYSGNQLLYGEFANQVLTILKTVIKDEYPDIKIASYSSRAKEVDSLRKKLQKDKYNEDSEITDLAGVRIITYSRKDIPFIEEIVNNNFNVDRKNSIDKTSVLGNDKVGYRGVHYVITYNSDRMKMPENKKYKNLKCEVQITSLIAHTWSEITHEKGYKFEGKLPEELERRKNLLAGMLELADMEMDSYVQSFDEYVERVKEEVERGGLGLEINSMSLVKYMAWKFPTVVPQIFRDIDLILKELNRFELKNISQLNQLIRPEFEKEIAGTGWRSLDGIIRNIMILNDADKYFAVAWNSTMTQMNRKNYELYKKFGVDIDKICKENSISIV